jgi:prepilin-type N-terminal cleavage/methylation domain-containing protein
MQISLRRDDGFTLIEIMIVVSVIALLAMIALPSFLRARKRSQAVAVLNELRLLDAAIAQYAIDNNKGDRGANYLPGPATLPEKRRNTLQHRGRRLRQRFWHIRGRFTAARPDRNLERRFPMWLTNHSGHPITTISEWPPLPQQPLNLPKG